MMKSEHFVRELELIGDEELRMCVKSYLDENTPDYFWTEGASSSGKYHPKFAQGPGGLVRHTKAVVRFAEELLRMSSYAYMNDEYKDFVIAACIVHDSRKYGPCDEIDREMYKHHAGEASMAFYNWYFQEIGKPCPDLLVMAITSHMGQWSTNKEDRPFTNIDRCVHLADYMASRAFIDAPEISREWVYVEYGVAHLPEFSDDDDLPF